MPLPAVEVAAADPCIFQYTGGTTDRPKGVMLSHFNLVANALQTRHWIPAAAYNVGKPLETWSVLTTGADPENGALSYRLYQRRYENALVLYKPLSSDTGGGRTGTLSGATTTVHQLGGSYRPLRADGTLGSAVTSISLRNGEGAILIKV